MRGLGAQARELGHELSPWLRQDDQSIAFCTRCTAHVYVRTSGDWVVDEDGLRELCEAFLRPDLRIHQYLNRHNANYRAQVM
jgi:hypothetical protein